MIPSAYRVSKKHRVLYATMCFLNDRDPVGPTRKWERAIIKATVDRRKLILEHEVADRFREFFADQHQAVLRAYPNRALIGEALAAGRNDLETVYRDMYVDVARSYGTWTARHLGAIAKAPDPFLGPVLAWLEEFAAERVADINQTTRERIQAALAEGTANGETVQEIASRIDDLFLEEIIPNRSMVIARTEVGNASNFAAHQAATDAGVAMTKTWNSLGDAFVRDIHADADGQTRKDDEPFDVGGEQLQWPGDISKGATASNVVNCRCFLTWDVNE